MHMEKINDGQIRCIMSENDLAKRKISVKALKYGSAEANALFKEIIEEAGRAFSFNEENYPVMVEAIPIGRSELMFIISALDEIEEMDPHFAKFANNDAFSMKPGASKDESFTSSDEDCPDECVFFLNSIEDLFPLVKHFGKSFPGETLLFNGPRPHTYYLLVMSLGKIDCSSFLRFINAIEEFVPLCMDKPLLAARLCEHSTPVMVSPLRNL